MPAPRPTGESYYRALFEACGEAFVVTDSQGLAVDCNNAALSLFGCERGDILGTTPLDWSPEMQPGGRRSDEWAAEIFSKAALGEVVRFEWENRRLDGSRVFVSVTVRRAIIDGHVCFLVVSRDHTERRRAEEALLASERRFSQLIQNAHDAMAVIDADGTLQYLSTSATRIFGYANAELIGVPVIERMIHPDDQERVLNALRWVIETGSGRAQYRQRIKSGGWVHLEAVATNQLSNPDIRGVVVNLRDITEQKRTAAVLERQVAFNRAIIDSEINGIAACHAIDEPPHVSFSVWNPAMEALTGYSVQEINRLGWYQTVYIDPAVQELARARMDRMRQGDHLRAEEWVITRKDGEKRTVQITTTIVCDGEGIPSVLAIMHDVTERRRSEAARDEAMTLLQAAIEQSPSGILVADAPDVCIRLANPAALGIRGGESRMLTGIELQQHAARWHVLRPDGSPCPSEELPLSRAVLQGQTVRGEELIIRDDTGHDHWVSANAAPIRRNGGVVAGIVVFHDISILKEHERQLLRLAHHDTLTGLPNRTLLAERLRQAMSHARRRGSRMGVILLDLDGFKWINDSVGHDIGDAVLVAIARRLETTLREQDTVARLGGDEFVLVAADVTNADDVLQVAEKALSILRDPVEVDGRHYHVSGSAGITLYPDDGDDEQVLIRNADIAMYQAKATGKNRSQFYAHRMQAEALQWMEMVHGLRQALQGNQFVLHYQPLVDSVTGRIDGAEALVRWQHPQNGMISPTEFIPVAEESGLIVSIGAWVLHEALRQMRAWDDSGVALPRMAVNFSALQFRETGLCDMTSNALTAFGVAPARLTVEITESVLMDDDPVSASSINGLEMLGVQVALDDFGTGYSSLSALKRFPVDCVKIDRSFVRDCVDDKEDANLISAIVQMAHSLNLKVVAEGVETCEQADLLRAKGCDQLQGYLINKPLPADAFTEFLAKRTLPSEWRLDR